MTDLYAALDLGTFDIAQPGVLRHLQSIKAHRPAAHTVSDSLRQRIEIACPELAADRGTATTHNSTTDRDAARDVGPGSTCSGTWEE